MECYTIAYSSVFARPGVWRPPHGEDGLALAIGFLTACTGGMRR